MMYSYSCWFRVFLVSWYVFLSRKLALYASQPKILTEMRRNVQRFGRVSCQCAREEEKKNCVTDSPACCEELEEVVK